MVELLPPGKPASNLLPPGSSTKSDLKSKNLPRKPERPNRQTKTFKNFRFLIFLAFFLIAILLSINVFVYSRTEDYIFSFSDLESEVNEGIDAEVAILLGASVFRNGELTTILGDRTDRAIDLYKGGYVKKILVTGDNSTKYYNEVTPTRNYLLNHGVPGDDIIVDNEGVDTFQSMSHAKDAFDISSALVVSQKFHLPRAVYIARELGIEAYGVAADQHPYGLKNDFRELFATVKSVWEVNRR